ncbi:diguanylate cyclase [Neptunicella sp. SCSIO 80796]|uniref:diguanylate cyclase n=1 Tax=Neptunicella plasticusilytica TaxID=3117012 RepID=UPI003A4E282B
MNKVTTLSISLLMGCCLPSSILLAQEITLNQEEQNYLGQHQNINYCIDPDWLPIEGIVDGQHIGLSADYIAIFRQRLGIEFTLVPTSSWLETLSALAQKKCDMIPMLNASVEREKYIDFTSVYVNAPAALVSLKGNGDIKTLSDLNGKTLAITSGYRYQEIISRDYPDITLVLVDSEREAIKLVSRGHVHAMAGSLLFVIQQIESLQLSNLIITGAPNLYDKLRVGISPEEPLLHDIMEKTIASIDNTQRDEILRRWGIVSYNEGVGLADVWIWIVLGLTTLLLLAYRYYTLAMHSVTLDSKNFELDLKNQELTKLQDQLRKRNKKLEYLSTHDSLTALVNRNFFEDSVLRELNRSIRHNTSLCLILIDMDNFKSVNDTYGHSVGDRVLIETAQILKKQVRSIDVVGRWGGEEFIILLPDTVLNDATALAKRICKAVASHHIEPVGKMTCSIGVSFFKDGDSLDTVFVNADRALYQAKEKGKNTVEIQQ